MTDYPEWLTLEVAPEIPQDEAIAEIHRIAERDRKALEAVGALPCECQEQGALSRCGSCGQ